MAKARDTAFFCKECGYESAKWFGQCPACREWNTASEEPVAKTKTAKGKGAPVHIVSDGKNEPSKLADINTKETDRMSTGIKELDRVLGGGIVAGSLVLVGGDPGIGKSTLLLQMCKNLSHMDKNVLYISGEESLKQIKMRAERIGTFTDKLLLLCETNLDIIEETMKKTMPDVVIIDSIQTMYREDVGSAPGSVSQVRESTAVLMQLAKGLGISIFIVGHVTKEGVVAGPRMLEHMVDTVLYFEGDKNASYRLLRGVKNRFGSTNEIGVFEMSDHGLLEVQNPSAAMLAGHPQGASGNCIACVMEGSRPLLAEVQALAAKTQFGVPRRTAAGVDYNRMVLLLAILEKRCGLFLSSSDVYVNVVGGMRLDEPAVDLPMVLAIASSFRDKPLPEGVMSFGEVGLTGELRAVSNPGQRINEAYRLGFHTCIMPMQDVDEDLLQKMNIVRAKTVGDAIRAVL